MSFIRVALRRIPRSNFRQLARGALFVGGATTITYGYVAWRNTMMSERKPCFPSVQCEVKHPAQSSVINGTKEHALYLTIHLKTIASTQECLNALGLIKKHVDGISPPDLRDESDEIWYGVGFGQRLWDEVKKGNKSDATQPFPYRARSGSNGDLPDTGGDIFIHAKCNERGKLFELCQAIVNSMPKGAIASFEDVYGWTYRGGRDLSGFIDGTENPADEEERVKVAIDPKTGGSYVVTQKWIHNHEVIRSTKDSQKEQWIGRDIQDSTELKKKTVTSHVARMVGSADFDAPAKYQIVRHSQPWGTVSGDSGLFFIAYSASPKVLDWMFDQMTGQGHDKHSDDVMRMTRCVTGTYWFFPSQAEFDRVVSGGGSAYRLWR